MPTLSLAEDAGSPSIAGVVYDAADTPAADVFILILDNSTGIPVLSDGTLLIDGLSTGRPNLLTGTSGEDGTFEINAPAGEYRLVAQRWQPPTQPWSGSLAIAEGLPHFGPTVELFGVADAVVPSVESNPIKLKAPGTGSLTIRTNPESGNNDTVLIIGTEASELDPVFAFESWRAPFLTSMIGMNRMPMGSTRFLNVPSGPIHLVAFANDNRPGFGAVSVDMADDATMEMEIDLVADWSNARHTPPERLMPLYKKVVAGDWDLMQLESVQKLPARMGEGLSFVEAIEHVERTDSNVTLPDGTSASLRDVMAVSLYISRWPPQSD